MKQMDRMNSMIDEERKQRKCDLGGKKVSFQ